MVRIGVPVSFPSLSLETGHQRSYEDEHYQLYRTTDMLLFPINHEDDRLVRKARVHGVLVNGRSKAYPIDTLTDPGGTFRRTLALPRRLLARLRGVPARPDATVLNDVVADRPIVVLASRAADLVVSYSRRLADGTILTFSVAPDSAQSAYPFEIIDGDGTRWDVLGRARSGRRKGARLTPTVSYEGYWFAWATMWPGTEIWTSR